MRFAFIKIFFAALFLLVFSCKKDEPVTISPVVDESARLLITLEPTVNSEPFIPETKWYTNSSMDSFTVYKCNYYISNIRLKKSDRTAYSVPESYHLIEHVEKRNTIILRNLPEGNYTGIEFLIGVDSTRNVSGAQTGALDPANNMFWDWNTGYVFYKLEGRFNTLQQTSKEDYAIHIGGFSGNENSIQSCAFALSDSLRIRAKNTSRLYFKVKIEEVFQTPKTMGFDYYYLTLPSNNAKMISENYKDMFVPYKIEN